MKSDPNQGRHEDLPYLAVWRGVGRWLGARSSRSLTCGRRSQAVVVEFLQNALHDAVIGNPLWPIGMCRMWLDERKIITHLIDIRVGGLKSTGTYNLACTSLSTTHKVQHVFHTYATSRRTQQALRCTSAPQGMSCLIPFEGIASNTPPKHDHNQPEGNGLSVAS